MESPDESAESPAIPTELISTVAIGIGVAVLAPELLIGVALGAGAAMAPRMFPRLGAAIRPVAKEVIKYGLAATDKARECFAEASEHIQDLMAEVRSEQGAEVSPPSVQTERAETPKNPVSGGASRTRSRKAAT